MDTELATSIAVVFGLPIALCLVILFLSLLMKLFLCLLKPKVEEGVKKAKDNIVDAIELHKDKDTIEYQESLIDLIAAGYTEEQAKAMLKASKKIEQLNQRSK